MTAEMKSAKGVEPMHRQFRLRVLCVVLTCFACNKMKISSNDRKDEERKEFKADGTVSLGFAYFAWFLPALRATTKMKISRNDRKDDKCKERNPVYLS